MVPFKIKFKINSRYTAQSAIEYLTTYGWALIIIAVALSAIASLGIFAPSKFVPQECILSSGISCSSYTLSTNGILTITLIQTSSDPINITAIGCFSNGTKFTAITPKTQMQPNTEYTFNVQCYSSALPFSGSVGTLFAGTLQVNYTDAVTLLPGTSSGKIVIKAS